MNLSSMLNDGPPPERKPSQPSPASSTGRASAPQASSLPPTPNGQYPAGPYAPPRLGAVQTPLHGPPSSYSIAPHMQQQGKSLTPLQTPSQAPGGGQYPFPPQHVLVQSPAPALSGQQQHRPYEGYSATTPGARPSSHDYASAQPSPGPGMGHYQQTLSAHTTTSLSPTPSSHHSQTPHSVRQSPLAMGHSQAPSHAHAHALHSQHSQPSTPLGPPQLPQRHSNHQLDLNSPYHQRTYSGASNGMPIASPAQRQLSIENLVESPSAHHRPSPAARQPSDHQSFTDRERSLSVSPKTVVAPRPQSLDSRQSSHQAVSRHSSQQEAYGTPAKMPMPSEPFVLASTAGFKRPADTRLSTEPPAKRGRTRKYRERPIWAQLSAQRNRGGVAQRSNGQAPRNSQGPENKAPEKVAEKLPQKLPEQNGEKPWLQNPPLDNDLVNARNILGGWEKSIRWDMPIAVMTRPVMDWLYQNLEQHKDAGTDPREGSIEIEAKIGTLIDNNTGQRCVLPVEHPAVISPHFNRNYAFESQMNENEHKNMNKFLNECVQTSRAEKGREPMLYEHIRETDSFRTLSDVGLRSLPAAAQKRQPGRDLKLRTSVRDKDGAVSARIVKIKIGDDLHIWGAREPYDVRISMNLEVNLDRPDLDLNTLTEEPSTDRPPPPNRHKDRLSYKHLAYHVDLTRVDVKGMPPKYELEMEVDAGMLRQQMALQQRRQKNAYIDIVEGFVTNIIWLMKQQR